MKLRARQDFAQTYAGNKHGFGISIENYVHIKEETIAGNFAAPSIGVQGSSVSDATPSEDISASLNRNGRIAVDGGSVIAFGLSSVTGLTTGAAIAAALETAINTALSTAGLDSRVWAEFDGGLYKFYSQKTGEVSAVAFSDGLTLDLMTELKLGTGNGGIETAGTGGGDYLWMTKASLKVSQDFENSEHKSGRQASSIIKKKKMAEGDIEMYFNAGDGGSPTMDLATQLLLQSAIGAKQISGGEIKFDGSQANSKYFTVIQGNNAFGRAFTGGYAKSFTISLPGDGEAKMTVPVKLRDGKYAGIGKIDGVVTADDTVEIEEGLGKGFEIGSRVMVVKADGRTVLFGYDGSITVLSRDDNANTVTLSADVDADDAGFLVPWLPHCFDQEGTDNPVTGLEGSVIFDDIETVEEINNVEFMYDPKVTDFDDWYGADSNRGFVVGDRADINCNVTMVLSASQIKKIVQAKEFVSFAVRVRLGPPSGRRFEFYAPRVIFAIPDVEIPDSGSIPMTLNGKCLQSSPGALDAFSMRVL